MIEPRLPRSNANEPPDSLPADFNEQLDHVLELYDSAVDMMRVLVLAIWKQDRNVVRLFKSAKVTDMVFPFSQTIEPVRIELEAEAIVAIKTMTAEQLIDFLKNIQSIRKM